jgi:hypothetical protein
MLENHNHYLNGRFAVEERRRQVAALLSQSMTQDEIARVKSFSNDNIT